MSGWMRTDVFLGNPMRVFSVGARDLRESGVDLGKLFDFDNAEAGALILLAALERADAVPAGGVVLAFQRPPDRDAVMVTVMHPTFARNEPYSLLPIEDVRLPVRLLAGRG